MSIQTQLLDKEWKQGGQLVEKNGVIYNCVLNQTDIDSNKNKFYIMQLIKHNSSFTLLKRWGRISEKGTMAQDSFTDEQEGIKAFEKQFRSKTGNIWGKNFNKKAGKYFMSQISYEEELKDIKVIDSKIPESKLPERTQKLISLLSDTDMMNKALVTLDIDTKKLPLGKIKQTQLDDAGKVLEKIQNIIPELKNKVDQENLTNKLTELSSEYYTLIPGNFARKKPPIINSEAILNKYRDTLDELRNIVVNVQIQNNIKANENPVDSIYKDIDTIIKPLERETQVWKELEKYISNTKGPTHGSILEIMDIFEIEQKGKKNKFDESCLNLNNRTLLFHGTPMSCCLSIFKKDFYLNPELLKDVKIQIAGKLLGYGVYFADCCTKSFNYCRAYSTNDVGCLIVAEVALGKITTRNSPDYNLNKQVLQKTNHNSVQGVGKYQPSEHTMLNNMKIPNGAIQDTKKKTYLKYNEFVVYDINQILIKYFIIVKNKGNYEGY